MCLSLTLNALAVGLVAAEPPIQGAWEQVVEHAEFSPRDTAEDLVFDGKMWVSNAFHNGNVLVRDLWSSPDGKTWTLVNDATPYDGYSEMVVYRGKMWAIKGSVWTSTDGVSWTQVAEKTPFGARSYGETLVWRDKIWQLGSGQDVWTTTDGVEWTCVQEAAAYGKRHASAVAVYQDKLWLVGGSTPEANDPPEKGYATITTHNDVWSSDDGVAWTQILDHAPWLPRHWFIAREYAGRLWILGGHDNAHSQNFGDAWATEDGVRWRPLVSETWWSPRHEPTVFVFDGSLWVVDGNSWPLTNDVWRITLQADR